jgi:hypothetical protein
MRLTKRILTILCTTLILSLIAVGPIFVEAATSTLGNTQTGTTTYPGGTQEIGEMVTASNNVASGYLRFNSITADNSGTLTHLGINVYTAAGNIMMAIYTDNSDSPGSLLGYTASTPCVEGWNDLELLTPVAVTSGTVYWLGFENDASMSSYRMSSGTHRYQSQAYGSFPETASTTGSNAITHNMRITYTGTSVQGYARATQAELTLTIAKVTSMHFYSSTTGNFRLGIYDDNGGSPDDLLWQSASTAATVGWNTVNIPTASQPTLQPGIYWLAYQWDSTAAGPNYIPGSSGTGNSIAISYGDFPSSWTGGSASGDQWSIYATYEITGTTTPTPPPPTPTPMPTPVTSSDSSSGTTSTSNIPATTPSPTATPTPPPTGSVSAIRTTDNTEYTLLISGSITSSQITGVAIKPSQSEGTTAITFSVSGPAGETGFANMTIPKNAIPYGTLPVVYIDGTQTSNQGYTQDSQNYYVWYTTAFSTHNIEVFFAAETANTDMDMTLIMPIAAVAIAAVIVCALVFLVVLPRRSKPKTY